MRGNRRGIVYMALIVAVLGGIYLYTELQSQIMTKPPELKAFLSDEMQKEAQMGTYEWRFLGRSVIADSDHPANLTYTEESRITASSGQRLYLTPLVESEKVPYEIISAAVSEKEKPETEVKLDFTINGDAAVISIPEGSGTYVYSLQVDYLEKGDAVYGLEVLVDVVEYDVEKLRTLKTPYVGNASKVLEAVSALPLPGSCYVQRYISLETEIEPYGITVYYEPKEELTNLLQYPEAEPVNEIHRVMEKNALVLLSLVENADKITFKVKNEPSEGMLEKSSYDGSLKFTREELTEKYGPLDHILSREDLFGH